MVYTNQEVLQFVRENDVKFVKLMFCDINGELRNISILAPQLERIFEDGLYFNASKIAGVASESGEDLYLKPCARTLTVLPWRPQQGRVARLFCNIVKSDGKPYDCDSRQFLQTAVDYASSKGYNFTFGTSCEFYVFEQDEKGRPTDIPIDNAGYCYAYPQDKGENIRREICLALEQMGITPESSRHESGPGQCEIDFNFDDAMSAADNYMTFKNVVSSVSGQYGYHASFKPKPIDNDYGSGLHISIIVKKFGKNIIKSQNGEFSDEFKYMTAGILEKAIDMSLFTNSTENSYKRLGTLNAPKSISWSTFDNGSLLFAPQGHSKEGMLILRSPDNMCNIYYTLGLVIYSCLYGIENKLELCEPMNTPSSEITNEEIGRLKFFPSSLEQSVCLAKESGFLKSVMPESLLQAYIKEKSRKQKS